MAQQSAGLVQIDRLDGFAISIQDDGLQLTGANRDLIDRFTKRARDFRFYQWAEFSGKLGAHRKGIFALPALNL
ncbi:MAG: hypothetical protein H6970_16385 [Gammaproteobacteria bacterium]|nr:hypothetical protein [Gammaproteobacteria bacterium]